MLGFHGAAGWFDGRCVQVNNGRGAATGEAGMEASEAQLAPTRDDRNAGDDVSWWQAMSRGGRAR
jgi:hypothetical protein